MNEGRHLRLLRLRVVRSIAPARQRMSAEYGEDVLGIEDEHARGYV